MCRTALHVRTKQLHDTAVSISLIQACWNAQLLAGTSCAAEWHYTAVAATRHTVTRYLPFPGQTRQCQTTARNVVTAPAGAGAPEGRVDVGLWRRSRFCCIAGIPVDAPGAAPPASSGTMQSVSRSRALAASHAASKPVGARRTLPARRQVAQTSSDSKHKSRDGAVNASSSGAAAASQPEGFKWGADMKSLGICVGLGAVLWFVPSPEGVSARAWHLLAIFVSTIVGIITQPLPLGAVAMIGLGVSMVTSVLTFEQAFSAFSSQIPCASADCLHLARVSANVVLKSFRTLFGNGQRVRSTSPCRQWSNHNPRATPDLHARCTMMVLCHLCHVTNCVYCLHRMQF